MLDSARIDLMLETELTLRSRAKKLGLDHNKLIKLRTVNALNNELSFAFNKQTDLELVKRFQQAFIELDKAGMNDKIKQHWKLSGC